MPRITMTDLAGLAGVDVSTVSRALQRDRRRVAATTIERIQALADQHGFRPDPLAVALRTGRSGVLAVLVPTVADVAVAAMLDGIAQECSTAGYLSAITPTRSRRQVRDKAINSLLGRRVDGVILADSPLRGSVPGGLQSSGVPYLMALRSTGNELSVVADDQLGGRLAAKHLLERGHHRMAVIAGPRNASTSARRLSGFRQELQAAGIALVAGQVAHSEWGVKEGHAAMASLLAAGASPTAVFALNDYNAIGAARALQDVGLLVGRDVALVGYNDISISAELQVPLTSVHNDLEWVGRLAVQALLSLIRGEKPAAQLVAPRLEVRESSAHPVIGADHEQLR